jgi:hypothetical protein
MNNNDLSGAPEEIRTPDPQIRSKRHLRATERHDYPLGVITLNDCSEFRSRRRQAPPRSTQKVRVRKVRMGSANAQAH